MTQIRVDIALSTLYHLDNVKKELDMKNKSVHSLTDLSKALHISPPCSYRLELGAGYQVGLCDDVFYIYHNKELIDTASPKTVVDKVQRIA